MEDRRPYLAGALRCHARCSQDVGPINPITSTVWGPPWAPGTPLESCGDEDERLATWEGAGKGSARGSLTDWQAPGEPLLLFAAAGTGSRLTRAQYWVGQRPVMTGQWEGSVVIHDVIQRALRVARSHVAMDVGFVSEFRHGQRVFRYVDAGLDECPVEVGAGDPADDSYCHLVATGQVPELLRDPSQHALTAALPVTGDLPVGTHISVPIRFSDGSVYGTFCCFSFDVRESVNERDLSALRLLASLVAEYLEDQEARQRQHYQRRERLHAIVAGDDLMMVFQPIVGLSTRDLVGYEALARFPSLHLGPHRVFAEAWELGLGVELEMKAIRAAFDHFSLLRPGAYMAVNVSPTTLTTPEFQDAVSDAPAERLVVEVTEHAVVDDYNELLAATEQVTALGVRLSVDDVGTGFSGLNHIVQLCPDVLKIDATLVHGVDDNPAKQAMISALVTFAARRGTTVVGEGIETEAELHALRVLGVAHGQGYHISRPSSLPDPLKQTDHSEASVAPEAHSAVMRLAQGR